MAKAPAKKRAPAKQKAKSPVKTPAKKPAGKTSGPPKPKFDKEAFVFETPIEKIEEALKHLEEQDEDPMAQPLTADQTYWWGVWLLNLPEAKRRGLKTVPTCAVENAVLGLYDKSAKRKKK